MKRQRRTVQSIESDIAQVSAELNTYQSMVESARRRLRVHKEALAVAKREPSWIKMSGERVHIHDMNDGHLINAIKVCLRMDSRYDWTPARMMAFAHLIIEADIRDINFTALAEGE